MKSLPFLVLLSVAFSYGLPVFSGKGKDEKNKQLAQDYLKQYYELENEPEQKTWKGRPNLEDKVRQMQEFFGLNVTGTLNAETLDVLQQPRCGVPDIGQFFLAVPGWKKNKLTYRIVNYTPDMGRADVDAAIRKAFDVWSTVTPLTFISVQKGKADMMIQFRTSVHGRCPRYFDGPLGSIGHAFPPAHPLGGNVHFDEDENWTADSMDDYKEHSLMRFNLMLVAAHEIGHALGLAHSSDPNALMYPNYKPIAPTDFPLSQDDIDGIQTIYGPSRKHPTKPANPTFTETCDPNRSFDAVTTVRKEIIFLKGRHLWRVYPNHYEVDSELISTIWPFLPFGIEAAYENVNDQVFFFKDNCFWIIKKLQMQPGYPKALDHLGFPPNVQNIDAAVFDKDTGKTHFFVGDQYWRYDEKNQSMDKAYPRNITEVFPGIGERVDAVFKHNGFFYFFYRSKQWEFDPKAGRVIRVMKSNSWFNC